jgi:hypothetical protein
VARLALLAGAVFAEFLYVAAATVNDFNVWLNVITIVIALAVAVPVIRSRRKDAALDQQEKVIAANERRINQLERDLAGATRRAEQAAEEATRAAHDATHWRSKYEEQEKYAAPQAFALIERHIGGIEELMRAMFIRLEVSDVDLGPPNRAQDPPRGPRGGS